MGLFILTSPMIALGRRMGTILQRYGIGALLILCLGLGACSTGQPTATPSDDSSAQTTTATDDTSSAQAPPTVNEDPEADYIYLEGTATVEVVVNGGSIVMEVNGEEAPITAGNFVDLVQRGVYDGTSFHRVIREPEPFVAQGGDPQSKDPSTPEQMLGTGSFTDPDTGLPRYIPLEIKPEGANDPLYSATFESAGVTDRPELPHTRGAVAMARSQVPDSASAQFYITLADLEFLDGSYAVFGYVTDGMDVVDQIQQGDRIEMARVISGADSLVLPTE